MAELDTQRTQRLGNHLGLVGAKEHDIAIHRANTVKDHIQAGLGDILDDRRLQPLNTLGALIDLDIGQTLGAVDTHVLGVIVDLLARHARAARDAQCGYTALGIVGRTGEDLEFHILELIFNIHQFQRNAQIRLVRTITAHGFGERHMREVSELDIQHFLEQLAHHAFGQADDVLLIHKAGFNVDLGKFRLTVSTQIFITEALGDLVVTVKAGHHQ